MGVPDACEDDTLCHDMAKCHINLGPSGLCDSHSRKAYERTGNSAARVDDDADFKVHTRGAGEGNLKVQIIGPGGVDERVTIRKVCVTI